MSDSEHEVCSLCGTPLAGADASGHCPTCLFGFAGGGCSDVAQPDKFLNPLQLRDFGDYELESELARGGMGVVYRGRQLSLNRPVAIKMIIAGQIANAESIARFKLEAESAASLDHPNIVPVYEIGEHEMQHYFSMKLIEDGQHVSSWAASLADSPSKFRSIAAMAAKIARALGYAHEHGVLHRDVKPSNVLIDTRGEPQLTDFGLAKQTGSEHSLLTLNSTTLGSPAFMAPEQAKGDATVISDVYGLGAVLYGMLTGSPPFQGETAFETLRLVSEELPRTPRSHNNSIPEDLQTICLKCLEKDPSRRYASARELAEDLERFTRGEPVTARPVGPWGKARRWCGRNPALAATMLFALFATVIGLTSVLWQWREASASRAVAERERDDARWQSYRALMMGASSAVELNQGVQLRAALEAAPVEHRNWEWDYFSGELDHSLRTFINPYQSPKDNQIGFGSHGHVGHFSINDRVYSDSPPTTIWDAQTGDSKTFPTNRELSPDLSRIVGIEADGSVVVRDTASGEVIVNIPARSESPWKTVSFAGNKDYLVLDSDERKRFTVWNCRTNCGIEIPRPDGDWTFQRRALPRSGRLLVVWSESRSLHDLNTGQELSRLPFDGGKVFTLAISPDESLAAAGELFPHGDVRLWDLDDNGKEWGRLEGHGNTVNSLSFDPTGERVIAGGIGRNAYIWDVVTQTQIAVLPHRGHVRSVAFNYDGSLAATASNDRAIRIWDGLNGRLLKIFRGHHGSPSALAFSPSGGLLASAAGVEFRIWPTDRASLGIMAGHTGAIYDLAVSPDGQMIASASWDSTCRLWDQGKGKMMRSFDTHGHGIGAAFSPDGEYLAFVGREELQWRKIAGDESVFVKPLRSIPSQNLGLRPAFSPDSARIMIGSAGALEIYNVSDGSLIEQISYGDVPIQDAIFSPDGGQIAAGTAEQTRLWNAKTLSPIADLPGNAISLAYRPDGKWLAVASLGKGVHIWDAQTQQAVANLPHGGTVYDLAFAPDGARLFTACDDSLIRIWDLEHFQQVGSLYAHSSFVHGVAMMPDGQTLVSGGGDGMVRIWRIEAAK